MAILSQWKDENVKNPIKIGLSREKRAIHGFEIGSGDVNISLLAGSHADEPIGPVFLRRLVNYLQSNPDCQWLQDYCFYIVPDVNPDGALVNAKWFRGHSYPIDLISYLSQRKRELPGDDIEFGYPIDIKDSKARPENQAVFKFWNNKVFHLHISFHGMGFSAGPWFLLEKSWDQKGKLDEFKKKCLVKVNKMGYVPHDVERHGEKGFWRLGKGFCTRPDSKEMKRFFLNQENSVMAEKFRPSSMESIRSISGDVLTLVSEMPLFILPGVGKDLGPPDPIYSLWKTRIAQWELELSLDVGSDKIRQQAQAWGLKTMPIEDQLYFQALMLEESLKAIS
jgi:hypothetical protein